MPGRQEALAIRDALIRQGMDPAAAEREAGLRVMRAAQEAAVTYGNGADVDNLAAADSPFAMEAELAPAGSSAAMLAARDAKAAEDWEARGAYYAPKEAALAETYGPAGAANAAVTESQLNARLRRREAEEVQRHSGFEEEQRIARMAKRAGLTIEDARALVQEGYDKAAEARGIPPGAAWQASGQNRTVPPDFDQFRDAYSSLRDAVKNTRMADEAGRKAEVAKRAQLAQNPMGYIGRDDITEEQRDIVNARLQGRRRSTDDPRIRVAEIQAKAASDQVAAERESRVSQQQWAETTRLAAERARQEFEKEQNRINNEARMAEGNAARQAANELRQKDLDDARLKHEELMGRMKAAEDEAARRHDAAQTESRNQFTAQMKQFDARYGLDEKKLEQAQKEAEDLRARIESEALLKPMEAKYGEGVRSIAAGDYGTPVAEESLKAMARDSDEGWLGFWEADGRRMDAILSRLGVTDQEVRRALVERFGYGSPGLLPGSGDGRGGLLSNWFAGRPW